MTKPELEQRVEELRVKNTFLLSQDEKCRKALTSMLRDRKEPEISHLGVREATVYEWERIYFELGKLVEKRDYVVFEDVIRKHEQDIEKTKRSMEKVQQVVYTKEFN